MREYKFRGRSIEPLVGDDQWLYGFGVHVVAYVDGRKEYWLHTESGTYLVDPETVGQYTNYYGIEFYDGDIISVDCDCDSEYGCTHPDGRYLVVWNEETAGYALKSLNNRIFYALDNFGEENMHNIGNRWDNPDLLEGEKI